MVERPYPVQPWGLKSMWVISLFDLPVGSAKQRKDYTRFRKDILEDGYTMMQFSVYSRHCASIENAEVHVERMGRKLPPEGEVRFLTITDKQFARIRTFWGRKQRPAAPSPSQLELF